MDAPSKGSSGFIKLWRAALKHHLFRKPAVWHYFQFCMLRANWSQLPFKRDVNGRTVVAQYAQFISTIRNDSEDTGLTYQEIRTAQKRLEKEGMITRLPTRDCTIITVTNYNRFQPDAELTQHTVQHSANTGSTQAQHAGQHIYKKIKKNKKNNKTNYLQNEEIRNIENKLSESGQNWMSRLRKRAEEIDGETQGEGSDSR